MNEPESPQLPKSSTSRREFVALSLAAAGVGIAASACASSPHGEYPATKGASRKRPGPNETIRMAVVGIGPESTPAMGFGHVQRICALAKEGQEKVQIVAICDVAQKCLDRGVKHASEAQGIKVDAYRDYKKLFEREDLHGVLLAVPEHWHSKMAIDALVAGLDVYLEKPMTLRLEDALRLRAVVHANDSVFQVGTQYMQLGKYHKAKELIASGAIGKPTFTQTSYCRNSKDGEWLYGIDKAIVPGEALDWEAWCGPMGKQPFDPGVFFRWRRYRQWSTGIVGDLLVHMTTPLVWALDQGWPVRVSASGGHYVDTAMENHDQVNLTVEFEKGHTMIIAGSTSNEAGLEVMIRGHKANLYLGSDNCVLRPERIFAEEIEEQTFQSPPLRVPNDQDTHRLHWLDCMRTRKQPLADIDTATKVMVIVDLATRSMWEKSAFTFDPATLTAKRA